MVSTSFLGLRKLGASVCQDRGAFVVHRREIRRDAEKKELSRSLHFELTSRSED